MNRTARTILVYMVVAILVMVAVNTFLQGANEPEDLSLSEFQTKLIAGEIAAIEMKTRSDEIIGTFTEDAVVPGANNEFRTVYPAEFEDELTSLIDETGLEQRCHERAAALHHEAQGLTLRQQMRLAEEAVQIGFVGVGPEETVRADQPRLDGRLAAGRDDLADRFRPILRRIVRRINKAEAEEAAAEAEAGIPRTSYGSKAGSDAAGCARLERSFRPGPLLSRVSRATVPRGCLR